MADMSGQLEGKVALITGAARGQGAAEARLFVERGARVLLTDVLSEPGQALADKLGEAARFSTHDVSKEEDWAAAVEAVTATFGRLDVLVNNAGILYTHPIVGEDPADVRALLDVNLIGPLLGMRAVAEPMAASGGGSIVNISSLAGLRGFAEHAAYGSSKWALRGLTKVAALELGPRGIRVNSVHPGAINTPMLPVPEGLSPEQLDDIFSYVPLGRVGQPEDIARVVAFLASDDAAYMTGAELAVDGGLHAGSGTARPR